MYAEFRLGHQLHAVFSTMLVVRTFAKLKVGGRVELMV
jgi:hypothetical protein